MSNPPMIAPLQRALAAHPEFLRSRCIALPNQYTLLLQELERHNNKTKASRKWDELPTKKEYGNKVRE